MAKQKVVAAMSGGVDSSLAAALLQEQGYDVIGVTMQIWSPEREDEDHGGCCSLSAVDDARRVANTLGIPYYVMNFRELFERKVINYFCQAYRQGCTPNPCIACNRYIKFDALLTKARALGADFIATGHYSRIERGKDGGARHLLYRAADKAKDQSYALYTFTQEQLAHTLLPLGGFSKVQTRQMAAERGLTVANKPDSQEICFVPDDDYGAFLAEKYGKQIQTGPFITTAGKVVGQHKGLPYYTIGQRKGLGLALGEPVYVVALDKERNAVILGSNEEVFGKGLVAGDLNWIAVDCPDGPLEVEAKIRYSAKPAPAVVTVVEDKAIVKFKEPQRAITPGQAVVFYQDDLVVGGGTIEHERND